MRGDTQLYWSHEITTSKKNMGPRYNLTFRRINPAKLATQSHTRDVKAIEIEKEAAIIPKKNIN